MRWFQKLLAKKIINTKSYIDTCKELRLQYGGKHFTYIPSDRAIKYRNVISSTYGGRYYPDGYFEEKTANLSLLNAKQCNITAEQTLSQLPLSDEYDLLPPGASHESLLVCIKQDDSKLCYSNTHLARSGFSVTRDPVHRGFIALFDILCTFCSFTEDPYGQISAYSDVQPEIQDQRYFEETIWLCPKCGTGNLMEHRNCTKCGESRGW